MNNEEIQALMRPRKLSQGGFLGANEMLTEVLKADDETVKRLGLTHEQIAARIEHFITSANYPSRQGIIVDGKFLVGGIVYRGSQECPWNDTGFAIPHSNKDYFVRNMALGEQLDFPGAIVHLIRAHQFYEGKESPYRVDPEKAVRILEI